MTTNPFTNAAILALVTLGVANAQQTSVPSPLIQHYHAYNAALQKGDLATAEVEAAAALAASVEQYGDGGRTAVLSLNLAGVRLMREKFDSAIEPARKALALAEAQGEASRVDKHVARLILGRAELRTGGDAAVQRLEQAIKDAATVPGLAHEVYPAAVELGTYSFESRRFEISRNAWIASAQFADGGGGNADLALAGAKVGEAAAGIMIIANEIPRLQTGSRIPVTGEQFLQFDSLLVEAMDTIHHQAVQESPSGELTLAQRVWGQAYAWRLALKSKLRSEGRDLPPGRKPRFEDTEIGASRFSLPACSVRLIAEPRARFPPQARSNGEIGAVVLKIKVDDAGKLVRAQVAGSVGVPEFVDSVTSVVYQWRFEKNDSTSNCRMTRDNFLGIEYTYE